MSPLSLARRIRVRRICELSLAITAALVLFEGRVWADPRISVQFAPTRAPKTRLALFRQLAELGVPQEVTIAAGRSLEEVLTERCGFAAQDLVSFVVAQNASLNRSTTSARIISLFPCPFWEGEKRITVPAGVTHVRTLLRTHIGQSGPETTRRVVALNPQLRRLKLAVRDGDTILLPYASSGISFALRPPHDADPDLARKTLEAKFQSLIVKPPVQATNVDLVRGVQPGESEGQDDSCDEDAIDRPWPFDRAAVLEILRDNFRRRYESSERTVTVVIADTGIDAGDVGRLPLREILDERGTAEANGRDEDGNGFKDDRWGARMDPPGGFPASAEGYERRDHGIQVAATSLGGLVGDDLTALVTERVRLAIANVVYEDRRANVPTMWSITENAVVGSLRYATAVHGRILNWSIESWREMANVGERIAARTDLLIVAAAGNDSAPIDDYGVYPAAYVLNYPGQIITVAALARNLKLAEFSNHGRKVVDIAAPGCSIDTMTRFGARTRATGTSFAAPLVTFTAAMLQAQGLDQPLELKRRIMHTAELDPDLDDYVRSGGRLDVAKALAVADDIVEIAARPGSRSMLRGRILDPGDEWPLCGRLISRADIVRIVPHFHPDSPDPMRVWSRRYEESSGRVIDVEWEDCAAPNFDWSFEERSTAPDGTPSVAARTISMADVVDVVPREFPES